VLEADFIAMDSQSIMFPLVALYTAAITHALWGTWVSSNQKTSILLGTVMKFLFLDTIDQVVSIWFCMWCNHDGVGAGPFFLGVMAALLGMGSWVGGILSMIHGDESTHKLYTFVGLISDMLSLASVAVAELSAEEELPNWLTVADLLASVATIAAEAVALYAYFKITPEEQKDISACSVIHV